MNYADHSSGKVMGGLRGGGGWGTALLIKI